MSVGVDPSGRQDHRTDHATALTDLHCQGVGRHEDEGDRRRPGAGCGRRRRARRAQPPYVKPATSTAS